MVEENKERESGLLRATGSNRPLSIDTFPIRVVSSRTLMKFGAANGFTLGSGFGGPTRESDVEGTDVGAYVIIAHRKRERCKFTNNSGLN